MKKQIKKIAVFVAFLLATGFAADAQIYVKIRPTLPVVTRPAPRPHKVWVNEEWTVRKGRYHYNGGRWVNERRGQVWVEGHWQSYGRRGERWVPGHWQRG
jgi:hypothetical protein